ncbi:MAG: IS110 family transposase, partial [Alphaproteobacteria bacterium]|nr:IS110 family transposase [Alphaproteobacteria bacterium]
MSYIGVDLRTNSFTTCRLDADGSENFEACQLSEADVERLCPILDAGDELALEATANFVWFCGAIRPCVGRIVAVSPGQFQVILQSVKRTGRNNAQALAFFLSKGMLPETHLKFMDEAE